MTKQAAAALVVLVLLAGCEIKRGEDDAEPTPAASETATLAPEPAVTASAPASIIRPDVVQAPVLDIPPEPLTATIPFGDGGYDLDAEAKKLLAALLKSEQVEEGWPIVLRGHTDSEGDDRGNLFASRKRAEAVAGWLVEHGIAEKRIEVIAMGEQNPVAPNANPDGTPNEKGRARNRRVEVWVGPPGSQPGDGAGDDAEAQQASKPDEGA